MLAAIGGIGCDQEKDARPDAGSTAQSTENGTAAWFTEITNEVGLDFVHESGANGKYYMPESMTGGVALLDFDNDGDLDIYMINGHKDLPKPGPVKSPVNRLYRQELSGHFVDVTDDSGLGDGGYGMGVAVGDIDNDGFVDVYVTNYGLDRLFRNRGDGTFEDITRSARIEVGSWSCSVAMVDYDRDGFLDLYVTRYVEYNPHNPCLDGAGRLDYCTPTGRPAVPDVLLHNEGDATFTDVSQRAGIRAVSAAAGLGVVCEDFNDDGWPDIYVANDQYANYLWINQKNGTFRDQALLMGAAYSAQGVAEAGMGVIAADLDNDLDLDLFLTHFRNETNTLYRNLGADVGFGDVTAQSGFGSSSVAFTGFGTDAFDFELDGDLDIVVGNGAVVRGPIYPGCTAPPLLAPYAEPNLIYLNDGTGRFSRLAAAAPWTRRAEVTRGLATGDMDDDGDRDILLSNIQGQARLFRNDAPRKGRWLGVRAIDPRFHRDAIGARVVVHTKGGRFVRTIRSADSYLSSSDPRAHFGLGDADRVERIEVHWPDGLTEQFPATPVDRYVTLLRGTGKVSP